ncbi:L-lactate dehydrogenase [Chengkuizengella axinellae]|uniref:L-lactate dehydrogenase n=1 Tax=Chengkuizengella axinellae TaxID=3064388 RepID=A0ABT9IUG9_9BACL|nr:L-lactate dehydrogenase [Chengkuizengella sp. 2205SS18-9]MDP5273011.1 L-lactate dehydrogenase [Chengkuizengella sp. 2205SS18-9]
MQKKDKKTRVVVIGIGAVGSTTAYTLLLRERMTELVLIDYNKQKAVGDALDMNHGLPFTGKTKVWAGDYEDCAEADIVIIAAGAAQKQGETRLDLLKKNVMIFDSIIENVTKYNKHGILLIASNPVDIMSYFSWKKSGFPKNRVIGSGTLLDSSRFKYLIGEKMNVDPRSIHAKIIGEHGDSEVPVWSLANFAGMPLSLTEDDKKEIFENTRDAAYQIIQAKGSTYYAIALALDRICTAILRDESAVLNVSTYIDDYQGVSDVYIGIPCIVDQSGVREVVPISLTEEEQGNFQQSAQKMKEQIEKINEELDK